MSPEILLLLPLLAFVLLGTAILRRGRRRPKTAPASLAPARGGLVFQRPALQTARMVEMQQAGADKPPMFANTTAVLDGEIALDRPSSSS
jgi:hypothetical protein